MSSMKKITLKIKRPRIRPRVEPLPSKVHPLKKDRVKHKKTFELSCEEE